MASAPAWRPRMAAPFSTAAAGKAARSFPPEDRAAVTSIGAPLRRLVHRAQFLKAARGNRAGRTAFALQVTASDDPVPGVGFTVTKKVGNSPERNRIRRRLREAARACAPRFHAQHDYVLVGRREALTTPFATLVGDLGALIARVHKPPRGHAKPDPSARPVGGPPAATSSDQNEP
jgi:ribonuclease P protein component